MQELDHLLKKLRGNLSPEEELLFEEWLRESPRTRKIFEQFQLLDEKGPDFQTYSQLDGDRAWNKVMEKLGTAQKKARARARIFSSLKYAAVFLGIGTFGLIYFYNGGAAKQGPMAPSDGITLQLEDGSLKFLKADSKTIIVDRDGRVVGEQHGRQLLYKTGEDLGNLTENSGKTTYNTLSVPFGKQFQLLLADGTKVHLNAGSSLRYPTYFSQAAHREVFLKGEAFFEVAKNDESPFLVNVEEMKIRVLGTHFNVSSYPEDGTISTVLVEGSVHLYDARNAYTVQAAHKLLPNHKATWDREDKKISMEMVDTSIYTAWMEGRMVFRNVSFKEIRIKLERHFNTPIENHYHFLDQQVFNASFEGETLAEVLDSFGEDTAFQYEWKDRKIIITEP